MKQRTTFSYVYFLTRVFFIGYGFSFLFEITNKDSWLSFLIGNLLSLGLVFLISLLKKAYDKEAFLQNKGHLLLKLCYFCLALFVAINILFIFQTLASNFFLIETPNQFIILPALFLVYRITRKNWTTIGRVGSVLMTVSLVMVLVLFATLLGYFEPNSFLPVFTVSNTNLWQSALYYMAYSSTPLLFMIVIPNLDHKLPRYYFLANLTILIMGILIIGVLGPNLIAIYRYPEYMVLKGIKILNFIEKVENIFSIATLFDLFMALAISLNVAKEKLPKKGKNISFLAVLFVAFLASSFLGLYYDVALNLYYYTPIILIIFLVLILTGFGIHYLRKHLKKG